MSHSFNKIWIHSIWSTKDRLPLIEKKLEIPLYDYMSDQFGEVGCRVRIINGMPEHVHCLFLLNPKKAVSEIIQQVKGGTSYHVNDKNLIQEKFSWQSGYAAYSVSESLLNKTYNYIKNQKQHHQKKSFEQEYSEFLKLYGFEDL
jgi:REP element-mobilizing transposase RayT